MSKKKSIFLANIFFARTKKYLIFFGKRKVGLRKTRALVNKYKMIFNVFTEYEKINTQFFRFTTKWFLPQVLFFSGIKACIQRI